MFLVKVVVENIDMELPITLENSLHILSTHFHVAIMNTCQYGCLRSVAVPYFVGKKLAMNTTSAL